MVQNYTYTALFCSFTVFADPDPDSPVAQNTGYPVTDLQNLGGYFGYNITNQNQYAVSSSLLDYNANCPYLMLLVFCSAPFPSL